MFINLSIFIQFTKFLRHIKELAEHYILGKKLFWKNEEEKEEKEVEDFQLLYYLSYMVKSDIGGFPNPCALQICKWFTTKIIIFEERSSFLRLIDMKKPCFRRFFKTIRCRKLDRSWKIMILVVNHLHICNVQWLGNPLIPLLTIYLK